MKLLKALMTPLLLLAALALPPAPAFAQHDGPALWNDGQPEVVLGAYFDLAGTDSVLEGEVPDTLVVYLVMHNGGLRKEGDVQAVEYSVELPEGLSLIKDVLPDYSQLAMGSIEEGLTQGIGGQVGDQLLINTLYIVRTGEVGYDVRIRVIPHPVSKNILYASFVGDVKSTKEYIMLGHDAVLNPRMHQKNFKPVRSKG